MVLNHFYPLKKMQVTSSSYGLLQQEKKKKICGDEKF